MKNREETTMPEPKTTNKIKVEDMVEDILNTIERDREREIISRRFGLFDRKETLENKLGNY